MDHLCFFCLVLLCFHARLFVYALWASAGKGLTSWLSFVMCNCDIVTFPLVTLVRCSGLIVSIPDLYPLSYFNLLHALKFRVSRKSLEHMYISFVRPLLEYCDSVWNSASVDFKRQFDAVHLEATRIITGATKLCSIEKLLSDLGWGSLQNRRNKHNSTSSTK